MVRPAISTASDLEAGTQSIQRHELVMNEFDDTEMAQDDSDSDTEVELSRQVTLASTEKPDASKPMRILDTLLDGLHPMHFVITMGIGITSGVLYKFPVESVRRGTQWVGVVYFFINLACFFGIHILFFLKYFILCRRTGTSFRALMKNNSMNVFLGCEVMGITTIVNMIHYLRPEWSIFTYVLWWINVLLSIGSAWGITYAMFGYNKFNESEITATILLPIVTMTVVSSSGSTITDNMFSNLYLQLASEIVCVLLWANAICLGIFFLSVYFHRLMIHGLPKQSVIFSSFIPIGIMGQGGWGIQLIADNFSTLVLEHDGLSMINLNSSDFNRGLLEILCVALKIGSIVIALTLASFGICITALSFASITYWGRLPIWYPTMWAATFPLGTLFLSFDAMFRTTGLVGFEVVAIVYGVMLIVITTYCMICTVAFEFPFKKIRAIITGH